ncbi:conserved hypothetical protein, partial [Ricinus communis]
MGLKNAAQKIRPKKRRNSIPRVSWSITVFCFQKLLSPCLSERVAAYTSYLSKIVGERLCDHSMLFQIGQTPDLQ